MARPHRDTGAGFFHVFTHCVWAARAHFRDDTDRSIFLRELARVTAKFEWTCIGFCLMPSHYHLIVRVENGVLPRAMQSLNWRYAIEFNLRHAMRGHAQFARYGARRISDEADLVGCYRYVMRNPVEAGLCATPGEWPWSSYGGAIGVAQASSFVDDALLLAAFGDVYEHAVAGLRRAVDN
jgi:REP element-mobilizing transposase RayT